MKICVTSMEDNLDSDVDPRFGRCKYFLIIDTDSMDVNSISNDSMMASGGAGIQAAQMVAKTGIDTVITGNIGPNAFQTLTASGVKVINGVNGSSHPFHDINVMAFPSRGRKLLRSFKSSFHAIHPTT